MINLKKKKFYIKHCVIKSDSRANTLNLKRNKLLRNKHANMWIELKFLGRRLVVSMFYFAWMSQFWLSEWSLTRALLINFSNTRVLLFTKSKSQSQSQIPFLCFSAQTRKLTQHGGLTICDEHDKFLYRVHKKLFKQHFFFKNKR